MRSTRFETNFEHLIERKRNFERLTERSIDFLMNNHSISSRIVIRSHDEIVYDFPDDDFSDDFVEYLSYVFRIDRDEFLIMIQSLDDFEHLMLRL
jgi:hypothetical protein